MTNPTAHPVFFSVDVETTSTSPFDGELLTVGIQPVVVPATFAAGFLWDEAEQYGPGLHVAIDCTHVYSEWFKTIHDHASTLSWWLRQNQQAQDAAWRDTSIERLPEVTAAERIMDFVEDVCPAFSDRVFVGNPVSFDRPWIDRLFMHAGYPIPFSHRTLCLRSMRFGATRSGGWGPERVLHDPLIPHHALHDAQAQADDLIDILRLREHPTDS